MTDLAEKYRPLPHSDLTLPPSAERMDENDLSKPLTVIVTLRTAPGSQPDLDDDALPSMAKREDFMPLDALVRQYGASSEDIQEVEEFADRFGLKSGSFNVTVAQKPEAIETGGRIILLSGTMAAFEAAFRIELFWGRNESGDSFLCRRGPLFVPQSLAQIVEGVFGLDERPLGEPALKTKKAGGVQDAPTPRQVAEYYQFPLPASSPPQPSRIAIMEFGGGYSRADIDAYFTEAGLPLLPPIVDIGVLGASNAPGSNVMYDQEVTLDINVLGSVVEGAEIFVVFAPRTEAGWIAAIAAAVYDPRIQPAVISISWGMAELQSANGFDWTEGAMLTLGRLFQGAGCLGITVLASAGDTGSWCKISDLRAHVLYPSSDPHVLSCGGTYIRNFGTSGSTEVTWTSTGGGVSAFFALPRWQAALNMPMSVNDGAINRGVPDVAGFAAPGCIFIYTPPSGVSEYFWAAGTSITAPLYAGLVALINQEKTGLAGTEMRLGFANPAIYEAAARSNPPFRDIADRRTNNFNGAPGYASTEEWDACTGLGVINGRALLDALP